MLLAAATTAAIGTGRAGLRFEPPPVPREALLPAMDVAAFVGLAERGPLHQPVLVRDAAHFDEAFGGTPRIAWDAARARWVTTAMRDAVHAFFANGGRRCWAVRVADERSAVTGRMAVPALRPLVRRLGAVQAEAHSLVEATSPGSWSDGLALRLRLRVEALSVNALRWHAGVPQVPAGVREPGRQHLLRLRHPQVTETLIVVEGEPHDTMVWWHADGPAAAPLAPPPAEGWTLERLCLDLQCAGVELQRLGLAAQDRRCWWRAAELDAAFALRGAAHEAADLPLAWYTVGLGSRWSEPHSLPADARSALRRDGLAGPLHACFLDPRLAPVPSTRVLAEVRELRFGRASDDAAPLRGLHALLASPALDDPAEAVSLIVLPDATQPPWAAAEPALAMQAGIVLDDAPAVPGRALFAACDAPPWPVLRWGACGADRRERRLVLAWEVEHPAGAWPTTGFAIEEAGPDGTRIRAAQVVVPGNPAAVRGERPSQPREPGVYRFRLRACRQRPGTADPPDPPEEAGPWSATLELTLQAEPAAEVDNSDAARRVHWQGLAEVHGAALRLAAGRGDLVALLALPERAGLEHSRAHIDALRALETQTPATWPPPAAFGALYAPWLLARDPAHHTRWQAPDGPVSGLVARRCQERGPWVAPANDVLRAVLGVAAQDGMFDGLNPIETTPRGIAPMEARTLCAEPELAPLQVRRLIGMLRRLLEREGRRWAFEPLGRALRGAVAQRLAQVLEDLDRRGAFADEREPWQLRVDAGGGAGEGQLVVELLLKPAAALRVLRVELRIAAGAPAQWQEALA